jgi:hypothetical protein
MKADAGVECPAYRPLLFDQGTELCIVRIRRVLLKAECGRDEIDAHAKCFAQREHRRCRFRSRQAGQLVNGELSQVLPPNVGRKGVLASRAVLVIAALHLLEGWPDVREQLRKFGLVQRQSNGCDARAHAIDERSRNMCSHPACCVGRNRRLCEFRREVECDVACQQTAADERIFAIVELPAYRLVIGVEAPRDASSMKACSQLREHGAVAHAFDALALMAFRNARPYERKGHGVEPPFEHGVDIEDELSRNAVLICGDTEIEGTHRPFDGGPMQRREARADAERAASKIRSCRRKDRRPGIVLLHGVLQAKQVFPGRRKHEAAVSESDTAVERSTSCSFCARFERPRTVARRFILEKSPQTDSRLEGAVRDLSRGPPAPLLATRLWGPFAPRRSSL